MQEGQLLDYQNSWQLTFSNHRSPNMTQFSDDYISGVYVLNADVSDKT